MGGPTRGLGGVRRSCHRNGKCREDISEVQELSGVPPKGPGGLGRPFRRNWRGWEALLEGRDGAGGPFGWPGGLETFPKGMGADSSPSRRQGGVEKPSRRARRGQEALPESRER